MKILLINPPFNYYSRHLLFSEPLSLGYLAAYLRKFGYDVSILDGVAGGIYHQGKYWRYGLKDSEVAQKIKEFKPDLVGITCAFSLRIDAVLQVAKLVKRIDKKITTVVGGIHPTIFPKETGSHKEIDYVIIGEGEEIFLELIKTIESGKNVSKLDIDGCVYRSKGSIQYNPKTSFIKDLDSLPFPARDLLPMEYYLQKETIHFGLGKKRAASIITSRSCPMRCTFCCMHLSHGPVFRARSALNVFEEIEEMVRKYRVEEIFIMDDNFTFDKERVMVLCKLIIRKGLKFRWNTPNGIRADMLDLELVRMMKKAGCINVCIGIEVGNEKIRNEIIKKRLSGEQIERAVKICSQADLPIVGLFILGIPGETEDTFQDTIRMVKKLPFSMIATSFFTPFPGTQLYSECIHKGFVKPTYWKKVKQFNCPILETPDFNKQTLRKWEKTIYFEFLKSHFWPVFYSSLSGKNEFFKAGIIKRFLTEKFGISL